MPELTGTELVNLINSVFFPGPGDDFLGILVDFPESDGSDNEAWKRRRFLAGRWWRELKQKQSVLGFKDIYMIGYREVGSNNADLPEQAFFIKKELPQTAAFLKTESIGATFDEIFKKVPLFLAPTEFSATAPLKNGAVKYGFRAATMPGFCEKMIPALRIDYKKVNEQVLFLKGKLDLAKGVEVKFTVDDNNEYIMFFDLRYREAHASGGRFPKPGIAGNLPSGEAYIVPYEGEKEEKSKTSGTLPVQIKKDVVLFKVRENRAESVTGDNSDVTEILEQEKRHLKKEPAYGNMAELGFGILENFGLSPVGEILLDEKLGFHIAFGRSEHFGGIIGPDSFSESGEVIHLDRIYIPAVQPRIKVRSVLLEYNDSKTELLIENGKYLVF